MQLAIASSGTNQASSIDSSTSHRVHEEEQDLLIPDAGEGDAVQDL